MRARFWLCGFPSPRPHRLAGLFLERHDELVVIVGVAQWHDRAMNAPVAADADGAQVLRVFAAEVFVGPVVNLDGGSLVADLAPVVT